jgi:hypothetical protein
LYKQLKGLTMDAVERGQELMFIKMKDLPPLALDFAKELCRKLGGCMEVFLTAYAVYAQCVEGLECSDDLYLVREEHAEWFRLKGYDNAKRVFQA